jgi:hypothetical protein
MSRTGGPIPFRTPCHPCVSGVSAARAIQANAGIPHSQSEDFGTQSKRFCLIRLIRIPHRRYDLMPQLTMTELQRVA